MQLDSGKPLFFDGAFGTYYFSMTGNKEPCELANLKDPDTVLNIHREYIAAGVQAIKTNTFGANPALLPKPEELHQVLSAGWSIAQKAAEGTDVIVFANIGGNDSESAADHYLQVAQEFLSIGADHFLFETLSEFVTLEPALQMIKSQSPDAFIIVSFAISQDGYSKRGLFYKNLLTSATQNPNVDAVGINCVCGPIHSLELVRAAGPMKKPFSVMPNAGYPSMLNGRMIFEDNADYYAQKLADLYKLGVVILGGCCGSTPEHIRRGIQAVKQAEQVPISHPIKSAEHEQPVQQTVKQRRYSHKIIAVEVDPPLDADCAYVLSAAAQLKKAGVDLLTVADSPLSRTRADSIMVAAKIKREIGIDVMPHLCCRDRNHIALKGCLLGASFEQIHHVLAITGDPLQTQRRREGVFNFNSFDLISFIDSMNQDILSEKPFLIAGALNVNAGNFSVELERAKKKLELGAKLLLTQPIFSNEAAENYLLAKKTLNCTILAGILPVAGYKNALFLTNEVSGIDIPASVIDNLRDKTPEQAARISVDFSMQIIQKVYTQADGFYIMTPLRKTNIVSGLIEQIRRLES